VIQVLVARFMVALYMSLHPGWQQLRQCESGDNYSANTGNGFYGAYQFGYSTWRSMGTEFAVASDAPPWVQDAEALRLYNMEGSSPWPNCGRYI